MELLKKLSHSSKKVHRAGMKNARRRFIFERLEDRRMMAAVSWDGGGGNLLWSNPINWSGDQLPTASDDVTINAPGDVTIVFSGGTAAIKSLNSSDSLAVTGGSLSVGESFVMTGRKSLSISGTGVAFAAAGSTNIDGGSLSVVSGGTLSLPGLKSYLHASTGDNQTSVLRATGIQSTLDLSNLEVVTNGTSFYAQIWIEALDGGTIDLNKLATIQDLGGKGRDVRGRAVRILAVGDAAIGRESRIKLNSLVTFSDIIVSEVYSSLRAIDNGVIELGNTTTVSGVDVTFDSTSRILAGTLVLGFNSFLSGQGNLYGNLVNSGGTIRVGKAPTGTIVHGNFIQTVTGRLAISLDGSVESANYSMLLVAGHASIAGTMDIIRANSFQPDLFSDYAVISAQTVSGTFSSVTGGTIAGGNLGAQYGSSVVALSRSFDRTPFTPFTSFSYQNTVVNQRSFLNVSQVAGGRVEFQVYDPSGKLVTLSNATIADPNVGDVGPFNLKDIGSYEVRAYSIVGETPVFSANLATASFTIESGAFRSIICSEIASPGQTKSWEFETRIGDEIRLDVLNLIGVDQQLSFLLLDPNGRAVFQKTVTQANFNDADFGPLKATVNGNYRLTVDGVGDDTASFQFVMSGPQAPRIRSHALKGTSAGQVNEARFQFDQAMDPASFTLSQDLLTFQNASGNLAATGFRWQDASTLVITFAPLPSDSVLFMALAPSILNVAGVPLDQDNDRIAGEATDDQYLANLSLDTQGPFVIHTEPGSTGSAPIDRITFHYNEPIDTRTFTLADVTAFTGPGNVNLVGSLQNVLVGDRSVTVFFASQSASGGYSISIGPNIADASGNLMDQSRNGTAGQANDAFTHAFTLQSADLQVVNVTNPVNAIHGQKITLSWQVKNEGNDPTTGLWWDYAYLSADDKWDLGDAVAARVLYDTGSRGILNPGATYTQSVTVDVPGVLPGNYRLIIRSNILRNLAEADLADNTGVSFGSAFYDFPVLVDEVTQTRPVDYRQQLYYRLDITEAQRGGSVLIRFGTADTIVANELYVSRDSLPTRAKHDHRSNQDLASNQWIVLSNVQPENVLRSCSGGS